MIQDPDLIIFLVFLAASLFAVFVVSFMGMNPPRTWRGDPVKWLFYWGYREKWLREHGDKDQVEQIKSSTAQ